MLMSKFFSVQGSQEEEEEGYIAEVGSPVSDLSFSQKVKMHTGAVVA